MSFNRYNYPPSFKMLRQDLLPKAIEIGNSLLKAGYHENIAETIALSNAKLWACFIAVAPGKKMNLHLVPHPEGWALISGDASVIYFTCSSKNDALCRSRALAKNEKRKLYIHSPAGNISDSESFMVNQPAGNETDKQDPVMPEARKEQRFSVSAQMKREAVKKAKWLANKVKNSYGQEKPLKTLPM